ncbi:MAG: HEAT repeat domain-containing protein [Gemmatimonadaceae bacterium]|nr:HEAT repeat domain-containing protein [Gemmatimonadaceae bacterium]
MNAWRGMVLAACLAASTAGAQPSLASRINAVKTGRVRLTFAAREGVCGDGMSWFRTRNGSYSGSFNGNISGFRDVEPTCDRGPVRLVVVREGGETTELRTYVGGRWKADTGITDLGNVAASAAGAWLLQLAEAGPAKPARGAITAATITDSLDASSTLLRIAKDEQRPSDVRASALNWLGEVVGDKISQTLDSIAYEPGDREVRKQAIFALSRRPSDEAVPALLKMAESLPDRELRKTAVFWLVQSKDPRAVAWVEKRLGR